MSLIVISNIIESICNFEYESWKLEKKVLIGALNLKTLSTFSKCCRKRYTDFASGDSYHVPCPSLRQSAPGRICPCSGQLSPPAPGRWGCSCPRDPSVLRAATDPWRGTGTTPKILILNIVKVSSSISYKTSERLSSLCLIQRQIGGSHNAYFKQEISVYL